MYKNYARSKFFSESMPINTVETSKKHLHFFYCNPKKYLTSRLCNLTSRLIQKHLNLDENNPNWQLCLQGISTCWIIMPQIPSKQSKRIEMTDWFKHNFPGNLRRNFLLTVCNYTSYQNMQKNSLPNQFAREKAGDKAGTVSAHAAQKTQ